MSEQELTEKLNTCYAALRKARRALYKASTALADCHYREVGINGKHFDETWIADYVHRAMDEVNEALGATK